MEQYEANYAAYLQRVQTALEEADKRVLNAEATVGQAAQYSLMAGGKRVRGVLCAAVAEMLDGDLQAAGQYAAGVEMLHCYSLIHDDLPCMDDDDMRRGKPACHKVYGEANALLAGDTLLTAAFEVLAGASADVQKNMQAVQVLARAAGGFGMILGQELDLYHESVPATQEELENIHRNKTGRLIDAAVRMGGIAAGLQNGAHAALQAYASAVGLAFQIVDDVLDVTATPEQLGKPIHSDAQSHKTTFVTLFGAQRALEMAQQLTQDAQAGLREAFGEKAVFLCALAQNLLARTT